MAHGSERAACWLGFLSNWPGVSFSGLLCVFDDDDLPKRDVVSSDDMT